MSNTFSFEDAAKKALGKTGKMPKPASDPHAKFQLLLKARDAFQKSIHGLQNQTLDLEDAYSKYRNALKQYLDIVDGYNFELDESKPDDKKKIDASRDIMQKGLQNAIKQIDSSIALVSKLDELITSSHKLQNAQL